MRLVGLDRAGYGAPTLDPNRTVDDSAADVAELADHLGLDSFAMLGWSRGGIHARGAAAAMPQRVSHVVTCGSLGVLSEKGALRQLHWISATPRRLRRRPFLQRAWLRLQSGQASRDVSAFVDGAVRFFPAPDQAVVTDPAFRPVIEESQAVAWADGIDGVLADYAMATPLTFQMGDGRQHVDLFHGAADTIVDPAMAHRLDELIPDSTLHLIPDAGHFAVLTHWDNLMECLAGRSHEMTPS